MAKRRGAESKLTPEVSASICATLKSIGTVEDAASRVGIHEGTVFMWLAKGREQASGQYREFFEAVKSARAHRRLAMEAEIRTHAKKNWQALAWFMERTEPKRYAQRVVVHVAEELNDAVTRLERAFAGEPEILERALAALVEGDSGPEIGGPAFGTGAPQSGNSEAIQPPPTEPQTEGLS